tara:strand:- start:369 stop:599 length:231 start_codon:yes stop_codon:yes gene_type:complete
MGSLCQDCRKIKHLCSVYGKERILTSLDRLFCRTEFQESHKAKELLIEEKKIIETKTERLTRSKNKLPKINVSEID